MVSKKRSRKTDDDADQKFCNCCQKTHTAASWSALVLVGYQTRYDEDGRIDGAVELRNCDGQLLRRGTSVVCGSTLAKVVDRSAVIEVAGTFARDMMISKAPSTRAIGSAIQTALELVGDKT